MTLKPAIESSSSTTTDSSSRNPSSEAPSYFLPASIQDSFNVQPEPTGSATLSPVQMLANPLNARHHNTSQPGSPLQHQGGETVPPSLQNLAAQGGVEKQMQYRPVYHHWFFRREVETKTLWQPFSMHDSLNLEDVHNSNEISPETKVATDGGRYDVEILRYDRV